MPICQACGGSTIWLEDITSDVCQECGVLADPFQRVLESHIETPSSTYQRDILPGLQTSSMILKSSRSGNGPRTISGQDHKLIYANREEVRRFLLSSAETSIHVDSHS